MDTVTLVESMMRGFVAGKMIHCTVRSSPAGLKLPAGQYLLRPAVDNPVYGRVMSIEPMWAGGLGPSAVKYGAQTYEYWKLSAHRGIPDASKVDAPAGLKMAPASKVDAPAGLKMAPASKVDAPAALKMAPAGLKMAPASKVDSPGAPSAFHKSPPAMREGAIVVSDRFIAGNCLVVTSGFGDLVDALQRAGGVALIVT
jgi:hypothetical protein